MPKTVFVANTIVPSTYLNGVNNHVHNGQDDDGFAAPINLGAHSNGVTPAQVTGRLPFSNLPVLRMAGYRSGLNLSYYNSGNAWSIDVATGAAASGNSFVLGGISFNPFIEIAAAIRKGIVGADGANWVPWSAGNNGGGVPTTAAGWTQACAGDVWLHCFVLSSSDDQTDYDVGFDTDITAANLREVSGFDVYRRIGSVLTILDTTIKIVKFKNHGRFFRWEDNFNENVVDLSSTTIPLSQTTHSASVPPGVISRVMLRCFINTSGTVACACSVLFSDADLSDENFPAEKSLFALESIVYGEFFALSTVGSSVKISMVSSDTVDALRVSTVGWEDDVG